MSFTVTPTAQSALVAVQTAIVARADEHLSVPVWDFVPEDQDYPYVTVGEASETPDNVHGRFGRRIRQTLHVWDKGRGGFATAMGVVGELTQLLDQQEAAVQALMDGHRLQAVRFVDARPMRDPDPLIRHVPTMFDFFTEQQPP